MGVVAIAAELAEALRAQVPAGMVIEGFDVEVGELVELDVAGLRAELAARIPGAEVAIIRIPGVLRCKDCGAEYPSDEHPCPVCGSGRADLIHGTELGVVRARVRPIP